MNENLFDIPVGTAEQTLTYKTVKNRKIDLTFLPPTKRVYDKSPVYFIIAGGGWHAESKEAMLGFSKKSSDMLRDLGWAVVSIDYRVYNIDKVTMNALISDVMDSARYLARFQNELAIDTNRIVTSGHSAGGHLALMMALAPHNAFTEDSPFDAKEDEFKVVASAPLSPPTILYRDEGGYIPSKVSDYVDLFPKEDALGLMHIASPIDYVTPLSVPLLLVCGTHDDLVFAENSEKLYQKCRTLGAPCEIVKSVYGGHCFECMEEGKVSHPDFDRIQDIVFDFVARF